MALGLSSCVTPAPIVAAPPAAASVSPQMLNYSKAALQQVQQDWVLQRIVFNAHLTSVLVYSVDIAADGTTQASKLLQGDADPTVQQAISDRLMQEHFPPMPPDPRFHKTTLVVDFRAKPPVSLSGLILYQPQQMLAPRLGGQAKPLALYIEQIDKQAAQAVAALPPAPGASIALVVGVKPGFLSRAWVVAQPDALPPGVADQLVAAAETVPPIAVTGGPIVFAIKLNLWGGGPSIPGPAPFPAAWKESLQGSEPVLVPDGVFARIWP